MDDLMQNNTLSALTRYIAHLTDFLDLSALQISDDERIIDPFELSELLPIFDGAHSCNLEGTTGALRGELIYHGFRYSIHRGAFQKEIYMPHFELLIILYHEPSEVARAPLQELEVLPRDFLPGAVCLLIEEFVSPSLADMLGAAARLTNHKMHYSRAFFAEEYDFD